MPKNCSPYDENYNPLTLYQELNVLWFNIDTETYSLFQGSGRWRFTIQLNPDFLPAKFISFFLPVTRKKTKRPISPPAPEWNTKTIETLVVLWPVDYNLVTGFTGRYPPTVRILQTSFFYRERPWQLPFGPLPLPLSPLDCAAEWIFPINHYPANRTGLGSLQFYQLTEPDFKFVIRAQTNWHMFFFKRN